MKRKFFFCSPVTGCESNSYLGTKITEFLKINGWDLVKKSKFADCIIINTCGAVKATEEQSLKIIRFFINKYKNSKEIIVCGCLPKISKDLSKNNKIKLIKNLEDFNKLEDINGDFKNLELNHFNKGLYNIKEYSLDNHFIIRIASGCLGNCTYCAVKFSIGTLKSKPVEKIIKEFKEGIKQGYKQFFLFGDDCACYGQDIKTTLPNLLDELTKIKRDIVISMNYLEPELLTKIYPKLKKFFDNGNISYVRIPLQSGSDRILKLMGRSYKIKEVLKIIDEIKNNLEKTTLDTYLLIGFPTENEDDFMWSINASKHFDKCTFRVYSDRPNTKAAKIFPKSTDTQIKKRLSKITKLMKKSKNIDLNLSGELPGITIDQLKV